jgi:hypothetical protein
MKKLQVLLALFACAFLPLHAASLADLTYTTTGGKVTITDCKTAATGGLVIPDTIEGNPVTSIGDSAFRGCTSLTSITIPHPLRKQLKKGRYCEPCNAIYDNEHLFCPTCASETKKNDPSVASSVPADQFPEFEDTKS